MPITRLDAFDIVGDSVSSLFASNANGLPTVGQPSTLGLATDFGVVPIPEPSSIGLLAVGLGVLVLRRKRARKG